LKLITDGVVGSTIPVVANGTATLPTTYGTHTYQLVINFTDANGRTGTVTSNPQLVNILRDGTLTTTGMIITSNITANEMSFNYAIDKAQDNVSAITITTTETGNGQLVETISSGNVLSGNVTTTATYKQNTNYTIELSATVNGANHIYNSIAVRTLPNFINNGDV